MAAIYSLYIINKSGGLIFYKDYGSAGRMDTNDSLRVASLWHSMHAISQQLSPVSGCSGIELLQADSFDLHCFQSLTGTKFFVVCEPGTQHMEGLLKFIYELYTDYVLKNPFYEMEMPIRCELFDINLTQAVQKDRNPSSSIWWVVGSPYCASAQDGADSDEDDHQQSRKHGRKELRN
ncbi:Trafficking protein particle complex subunit 4 [Morus notabilis]|uniref:Trafficking protein particle complex subunit n=1 Tax=Morus notabilis TaxID=981085 RepID=W9R2Q2_9ROSA|nr:Trafficking protein particle complex subunit 4 [Morus notabilis]